MLVPMEETAQPGVDSCPLAQKLTVSEVVWRPSIARYHHLTSTMLATYFHLCIMSLLRSSPSLTTLRLVPYWLMEPPALWSPSYIPHYLQLVQNSTANVITRAPSFYHTPHPQPTRYEAPDTGSRSPFVHVEQILCLVFIVTHLWRSVASYYHCAIPVSLDCSWLIVDYPSMNIQQSVLALLLLHLVLLWEVLPATGTPHSITSAPFTLHKNSASS